MTQSRAEQPRAPLEAACDWFALERPGWPENAFAGIYHPHRPVHLRFGTIEDGATRRVVHGPNWALASTLSPVHAEDPSLVRARGADAVAFRGYVVEPPVHSHSPAAAILRYWLDEPPATHNGMFASAVVSGGGTKLSLAVDALGLGPLYYRERGGAVLFATNPALIAMAGDEPDLLGWRCLLECGFIPSNRTLSREVSRVPPGARLSWGPDGASREHWFAPERFPTGTRPVDDRVVGEVEEAFQQAIGRCLRLENGGVVLPLSSGHDSRRILSSLRHRGTPFHSYTVRVLQKGLRDLDATFASRMAADLGFPHEVVEFARPDEYVVDDSIRRGMLDCETSAHAWVIRLADRLRDRPGVVLDGILGDVLGNPGFRMPGMYRSREEDLRLILAEQFPRDFGRFLRRDTWPSAEEARRELTTFLEPWMDRGNMAEFAFILGRQRRATALQFQQLLPAGHLVVSPFADLDYLNLLFDLRPQDKHRVVLQRRCLERFWPAYARYAGNRDIPADMPEGDARAYRPTDLALDRDLRRRLGRSGMARARALLSVRGRAAMDWSRWSLSAAERFQWLLHPAMSVILRGHERRSCWTIDSR